MSQHPFLPVIAVALLCSSLPGRAQDAHPDFPEGPGKETFVAVCGGCHDINRARAGYTPEGWRTVVRIMLTSRYAMWMGYGPELTFFCNDAYLPAVAIKCNWVLGGRVAGAAGAPGERRG